MDEGRVQEVPDLRTQRLPANRRLMQRAKVKEIRHTTQEKRERFSLEKNKEFLIF